MSDRNDEYMRLLEVQRKLLDALTTVRAQMSVLAPPLGERGYRIALRPDGDGLLDDIVIKDVSMFRAERMTNTTWWIACYLDNDLGDEISWNATARSRPMRLEWTVQDWPTTVPAASYEAGSMESGS